MRLIPLAAFAITLQATTFGLASGDTAGSKGVPTRPVGLAQCGAGDRNVLVDITRNTYFFDNSFELSKERMTRGSTGTEPRVVPGMAKDPDLTSMCESTAISLGAQLTLGAQAT